MANRTCPTCSTEFAPNRTQIFCTKRCMKAAHRDSKTPCAEAACDRMARAKGLCATHYNQANQPDRHRKVAVTCDQCGDVVNKHPSAQYAHRFCSLLCRDVFRNGGEPTLKMLPPSHPVVRLMAGLPAHATPRARITVVSRTVGCDWCGTEFTTRRQSQRMCSRRCKTKAFKVRRRGQANGWASHYTWAEVMRLHLALGKACAYCAEVVDGQPDPDHVVPLSRGGSNSITNILSCCGPCNSDKRDLLLGEWNADRARRKLPPRIISDPRWIHLTSTDARSADTDVAQCG